ncbi:D-alanine-D-alanine ligase [Solimonas aquatica]|uniref:D-alanine-D-alanine ligase n=1 Tax=Solimonas aquatica TaxID=489703 RepID=A0A1H9FMK1_9GAMM|nr:ATP-grasp domain-containing protein [Solimonas aquatica]SEQ39122.1 D-alanine-D-alanine ligase [Solimonas aquatica]
MATRVLMLFDLPYAVKPGYDYAEEFANPNGSYTEADVYRALLDSGYEVQRLSLFDDVRPLIEVVREQRPDVIFNLCETFHNITQWDKNVAALIELLGVPCTGAGSGALFLCNDKSLCKKILRFHRVRTPRFHSYYRGQKIRLPKTLKLPCIVKPLTEEASRGISQASVVDDEAALCARVQMIHERMNLDAIAEEYVEGRELYMSIIGDRLLRLLPPRELSFGQMAEDEPRIATYKAKWDEAYRKRWGIRNHFAEDLDPVLAQRLHDTCKRAYRALNLKSYARFDLRVTAAGQVYVIEPNVNPCIARDDELAQSAEKVGIAYASLIRMLVNQALRRSQ